MKNGDEIGPRGAGLWGLRASSYTQHLNLNLNLPGSRLGFPTRKTRGAAVHLPAVDLSSRELRPDSCDGVANGVRVRQAHAVRPAVEALLRERLDSRLWVWKPSCCEIARRSQSSLWHARQESHGSHAAGPASPSSKTQAAFQEQFGVSFADACASKRLVNCTEFLKSLPEDARPSPFDLEAQWRSNPCVKLFPGTYCAAVGPGAEAPIVVNGFFPAMNHKFTDPNLAPSGVRWFVISWKEESMTWEDFRTVFIGATNPAKAVPESLRGHVFSHWEELGLDKAPFGADNSFHASASPVEAAYELGIWLGAKLEDTAYFKRCVAEGVAPELAKAWASGDAKTSSESGSVLPVFDACEHLNMSGVLQLMQQFQARNDSC